MNSPLSPVTYLAPPCFTTEGGLHFSPLAMEISAIVDHKPVALAAIAPGASRNVREAVNRLPDGAAAIGLNGERREIVVDDECVETTCAVLTALNANAKTERGEWEMFLAEHGWDDWPPAVQSDREGRLEAAAALDDDCGMVMVGTFCWEHAIRRCMGERSQFIDDEQFFQTGLPALCPDASIRNWNDLTRPSREKGQENTVGRA